VRSVLVLAAALLLAPACGRLGYDVEGDDAGTSPIVTDAGAVDPTVLCGRHRAGKALGTYKFRGGNGGFHVLCAPDGGSE
jgi:hypothetical protein